MTLFILCDDVFNHITSYLDFGDKINASNALLRSCFRKYDFTKYDKDNIEELFQCEDSCPPAIITEFNQALKPHYDNYYGFDIEHYTHDCYNHIHSRTFAELYNLFKYNFMTVFARKLAEHIEVENLSDAFYNHHLNDLVCWFELVEEVTREFQQAFDNKTIDRFCEKCGKFGHDIGDHSTVTTFAKLRG